MPVWLRYAVVFVAVLISGLPMELHAEVRLEKTRVSISPGQGVIRQQYRIKLKPGIQDLVLEDIPAEAELDSLRLVSRRSAVQLQSWQRADQPVSAPYAEGITVDKEADLVVWKPTGSLRGAAALSALPGPVTCRVDSSVRGWTVVWVHYVLPNMDWRATYKAVIRDNPSAGKAGIVALDLQTQVDISNPSATTFENAEVLLLGEGNYIEKGVREASISAGLWVLDDDSALSDLWRPEEPDDGPMFKYSLPGKHNLPAGGHFLVSMARSDRKPAAKVYEVTSRDVPEGIETPQPLRAFITMQNSPKVGLGMVLPPGMVDVFRGGREGRFLDKVVVPRTPVNGMIRLDLGVDKNVTAIKRKIEKVPGIKGFYEEAYEVIIQNNSKEAINVVTVENPAKSLRWKLIRSDERVIQEDREIRFQSTIGSGARHRIYYRLRIKE